MGRGHALELLEAPIEVRDVIEARLETHIRDGFVSVGQQFAGFADAQAVDEFDETATGCLLEHPAEVGGFHAQMLGDFLQGQLPGVMGKDIVHGPVGTVDAVLIGHLRRGTAGEHLIVIRGRQQLHQDEKIPQAAHALGIGNALHQDHCLADGALAAELDAIAGPFEQRRDALQFGKYLMSAFEQFVGEIHQHVTLGHHLVLGHLADPVVGQIGAGEKQGLRVEIANVIANEHLAGTGDDQVQLVFLMEMPAHQRAGKAVLAIDDGQSVMVIHQLVGRVGDSCCSGHGPALLLLLPLDNAPFAGQVPPRIVCRWSPGFMPSVVLAPTPLRGCGAFLQSTETCIGCSCAGGGATCCR